MDYNVGSARVSQVKFDDTTYERTIILIMFSLSMPKRNGGENLQNK